MRRSIAAPSSRQSVTFLPRFSIDVRRNAPSPVFDANTFHLLVLFIVFRESTGEPRSYVSPKPVSKEITRNKATSAWRATERETSTGRWQACQPADDVHAGGCNPADLYTRWTVETSPADAVAISCFHGSQIEYFLCVVNSSNDIRGGSDQGSEG